jgi:hypothetical protein
MRSKAILLLVVLTLFAGCRKKKPPAPPEEYPWEKAKRLAAELQTYVQKRDAEVTNCQTIVFDAAKKTIIDPTDYPKRQDPSDASTLLASPVYEAENWKQRKAKQVMGKARDKRLFDSPLFDYTKQVCDDLGGQSSTLTMTSDIMGLNHDDIMKRISDLEAEIARVKAAPPMTIPTKVAFYWHNCDPTPIRTFDSAAGTITVDRYACKAGIVWLSLPGGTILASAPGNATALPGKAVSSQTTRAEINAANDDAYDRALDGAANAMKGVVMKWKTP